MREETGQGKAIRDISEDKAGVWFCCLHRHVTVKLGEEGTTWWGCEHSLQAREVPDARTGKEQKNDDLVLQPQEFNSANNQWAWEDPRSNKPQLTWLQSHDTE